MSKCECSGHEPHASEVERNAAEARKHHAEARKFAAEAQQAELVLASKQRAERDELAKDAHHHVYVFDDSVSEASVKRCIAQLATWHRNDPACPIEILINCSPGGSIFDGFVLIDYIRDLRAKGHHITIVAYGMAASMAGVILQAADTRVIGENAFLLIHEGSLGAVGDFGKVEDRVALMKLLHDKILDLFEERAKPINPKTTKAFIRRSWLRTDWWLPAEDCLKFGFVDEVR